jgi:hypothetical protein
MDLLKLLVAEAVVMVVIAVLEQLLVALAVMADYPLVAVGVAATPNLVLLVQAVEAAMVWFVFILGNQL